MEKPNRALDLDLVVRETIEASAEFLFAAWTQPEQIKQWWGPADVTCMGAEVDLRVGGRYQIANSLPDGSVIWIEGEFEVIEPPRKLVYTWRVGKAPQFSERVTVTFNARGSATEVVVVHERIPDAATRATHEQGWGGCLDGLQRYAKAAA